VSTGQSSGTVKIYNALGTEISIANQNNNGRFNLNLGNVPAGIYYVELLSDKGRAVQKVIID